MEIEIALLPQLPVIYRDGQVSLEVSWGRLAFRPLNLTDDRILLRAESMARSMLERLPETPVQAVGINFAFREETPPAHVLAIFNDVDEVLLDQENWMVADRKLTRRLLRLKDVLNLSLTRKPDSVDFEFNFHSEVGTNQAAVQAVETGRTITLRDEAIKLLRAYHLKFEDERGVNPD